MRKYGVFTEISCVYSTYEDIVCIQFIRRYRVYTVYTKIPCYSIYGDVVCIQYIRRYRVYTVYEIIMYGLGQPYLLI